MSPRTGPDIASARAEAKTGWTALDSLTALVENLLSPVPERTRSRDRASPQNAFGREARTPSAAVERTAEEHTAERESAAEARRLREGRPARQDRTYPPVTALGDHEGAGDQVITLASPIDGIGVLRIEYSGGGPFFLGTRNIHADRRTAHYSARGAAVARVPIPASWRTRKKIHVIAYTGGPCRAVFGHRGRGGVRVVLLSAGFAFDQVLVEGKGHIHRHSFELPGACALAVQAQGVWSITDVRPEGVGQSR